MIIYSAKINNFRGICETELRFPQHSVLIGDNNVGKSTVIEAIDLVLGPDRLSRFPPIDEHDFFLGKYHEYSVDDDTESDSEDSNESDDVTIDEEEEVDSTHEDEGSDLKILIEVTLSELNEEDKRYFHPYLEWLDVETGDFYDSPPPGSVDDENVENAIRVIFVGQYDSETDDFEGNTYFSFSYETDEIPKQFSKAHKQYCGFLYLRSIRTGSRALSLERGSLLDIILRLEKNSSLFWEHTIDAISNFPMEIYERLGIPEILDSVDEHLKYYIRQDWDWNPHLKITKLTREHIRKTIAAFIATGYSENSAPFESQGRGTINILVLALLSILAERKQNVIFAMDEVETAIPPHTQKQIVLKLRELANQSLVTSHSPYVIEEYENYETLILSSDEEGDLINIPIEIPDNLIKNYQLRFRTYFCEALLSRRVIIAEGKSEVDALVSVARRLAKLDSQNYATFESLGISVFDAGGEGQIEIFVDLFNKLGKDTFVICDKQTDEWQDSIKEKVNYLFMHEEKGIEDFVLNYTEEETILNFIEILGWEDKFKRKGIDWENDPEKALKYYFRKTKGEAGIANFLTQVEEEAEIPDWFREICIKLKEFCENPEIRENLSEDNLISPD